MSSSSASAAITVDGDLSDWGVTVGTTAGVAQQLNYAGGIGPNPSNGTVPLGSSMLHYHREDTDDQAGHGFRLGPNYGGQDYDAEFLGVTIQNNKFHIAISTGQRADNQLKAYSPGDIRISLAGASDPVLGIEVGGGTGGSTTTQVNKGDAGTTYNLWSNGFTNTSSPLLSTDAQQTAGSIWATGGSDWLMDPIGPATPTQLLGGTLLGNAAEFSYLMGSDLGTHAFIELSIDLGLSYDASTTLAELLSTGFHVSWAPSCGNDLLETTTINLPPSTQVPEPHSILIFGGLLALGVISRWRRRK